MSRPGRGRQLLGVVVLVLLIGVPATASAATTVRTFRASPNDASALTPAAAPPVVLGAEAERYFRAAPGYPAAGVQGTSPGLEGTTVALASCAAACIDNYRAASAPAIPAGVYVERVTFTVTQPHSAGPAVGFDVDIAVHLSTGWVVGTGYFSTGVATGGATATLTLRVFINLGAALPTITAVRVTVDRCTLTTGCP